jgi:hypothetical protein
MYNRKLENCAKFIYNENVIDKHTLKFAELSGEVSGVFKTLDDKKQQSALREAPPSERVPQTALESLLP